jgi:LPS O-antigen subunit length determinant protein (WzzB/FepE family)
MKKYEIEEISLFDAFILPIWRQKISVVIITLIFTFAAGFYAFTTPNYYKAKAVLMSSNSEAGGGGLSSLVGQLGGLASMAGVNIGGDSGDMIIQIEELISSKVFLYDFITKHDILIPLMAAKKWNKESNKLEIDNSIYDESTKAWVKKSEDIPGKPSLWEASKVLSSIIFTSYRKKDGIYTLEIEHKSPSMAKEWLVLFIKDINLYYKAKDKETVEREISYLVRKEEESKVLEIKSIFNQLIADKIKTKMLADIKEDYALSYVAEPILPEDKNRPKRALILLIGCFIGFVVGAMVAVIRNK